MAKNALDSIRDKVWKYPWVGEIIVMFLLVGVIYFGVRGAMVLSFQTTSPMMGVDKDSMTHPDDSWKDYYEDKVDDVSDLPFQGGLQPGDLVIVEGVSSPDEVDIGDVIIWEKSSGKRIIHRVAVKEEDDDGWYWRTRSDKYKIKDPGKIRLDEIVGKAVFSIPYLGYPSIRT